MDLRKQEILVRQTAFQGIEANVVGLQSAARQLGSFTNDVFSVFTATSSDESILQAAASTDAAIGTYQLQVTQLAKAGQNASQSFDDAESLLTLGTVDIKVGDRPATSVEITNDNNTVQGFVDAINLASDDVVATTVNDGSGFRILLTSQHTGAENQISITNNTAPSSGPNTQVDFSGTPVQDATDAIITLGSGPGAVNITRSTNTVENVIQGLTMNLLDADPGKNITVSINRDPEPARTAIDGFVGAFNNLMDYVDEQTAYNVDSEQAGLLLGDSTTGNIRDQIRNKLARTVANLNSNANRLSSIGISFDDRGKLQVNSSKLDSALAGNLEGVEVVDVRRLFALDAQTTSPFISFISGSVETNASENDPWQVNVTQAAERASIHAPMLFLENIVIDGSNDSFSIDIDGLDSGTLSLTHGTYTRTEMAEHLQSVINSSSELGSRKVSVTTDKENMIIESVVYGTRSEVGSMTGTAATAIGFLGNEYQRGRDVAGYFLVDGQTETATGNGRILTGDEDNENTSGLQMKVSLNNSQITGVFESDLTVTRGFGIQMETLIDNLLNSETGRFKNANDAYDDQLESIDVSVDRLNSIFEAKQQQLISEFVAIESTINSLQTTSAFLASQLGSVSLLNN